MDGEGIRRSQGKRVEKKLEKIESANATGWSASRTERRKGSLPRD